MRNPPGTGSGRTRCGYGIRGGPLTLLDGGDGDTPSGAAAVATLGPDLAGGQRPQHVIPAGHWQSARPAAASEVLVSCVVAPGFDFADFTLLDG